MKEIMMNKLYVSEIRNGIFYGIIVGIIIIFCKNNKIRMMKKYDFERKVV